MGEPTKEQIERARRCAAKYWQTGDDSDEGTARMILSGDWDDQAYVQAALAAIIETQEWAAGIAEAERLRHDTGNGFDSQPCRNVAWRIREAIKEGRNDG